MLSPNRNTHQHPVVSREAWIEARKAHLKNEKALTRMRDLVSAERRRAALGQGREGVCVRHPGREENAGRAVRQQQPADRLSLHVAMGPRPGLQELLVAGRPCRRRQCPSRQSRRLVRRDLARQAPRPRGLLEADGLEVRFRFVLRKRFQLRLPCVVHRRADGVGQALLQLRMDERNSVSTNCPASASSTKTKAATSSILIRHTRAAAIFSSASTTTST